MDDCEMNDAMFEQKLNQYTIDSNKDCTEGVTASDAREMLETYKAINQLDRYERIDDQQMAEMEQEIDDRIFERLLNEYDGDPNAECIEGVTWLEARKAFDQYKTMNHENGCSDGCDCKMEIDTMSTNHVTKRSKRKRASSSKGKTTQTERPSTKANKKKKRALCIHDGCTKWRSFGDPTNRIKRTCGEHKLDGYVNLSKQLCKHDGCTKIALFGPSGTKQHLHCSKHKESGEVEVDKRICQYLGCQKNATWGIRGTKRRLYCLTHKPDDSYVNLAIKRCKHLNCELSALYGKSTGKKIKEFCEQHKPQDYVNISAKLCVKPGCETHATYGALDGTRQYCAAHKPDGYVNLYANPCQYPDCKIQAGYGIIGTSKRIYCAQHKAANHVGLGRQVCDHDGCTKTRSFGPAGSLALYCGDHKLPGHVNPWKTICVEPNCGKSASFASKTDGSLIYCAKHRPNDYILLAGGCHHADCNRYACFGKPASTHATYCDEHRPADYVNVRAKLCKFPGCQVRGSYRKTESDAMEFCVTHAPEGYIVVITSKCKSNGCSKQANFAVNRTAKAEYCKSHAPPKYTSIHGALCQDTSGCDRNASYGLAKTNEKIYCKQHAPSGYVNLRGKNCVREDCKHNAYYGPLFGDKIHCLDHKTLNEYVKNQPKCLNQPCKTKPCYTNQDNGYPLRCENHKMDNDKNIMEKKCSMCGLMQFILDPKTMCNDCDDFHVKKVHKAKETRIQQVLETAGFTMTHDRIPQNGCQKYRPDFVISASKISQPTMHCVIVEVDENQHQSYACECEQARMINLFQEFGGLKVAFVRYNPDAYTNNLGVRITSKAGREAKLIQTIESLLLHPPDAILTATYLYYDGFDGQPQTFAIDYGL